MHRAYLHNAVGESFGVDHLFEVGQDVADSQAAMLSRP